MLRSRVAEVCCNFSDTINLVAFFNLEFAVADSEKAENAGSNQASENGTEIGGTKRPVIR